jgi:hypothetical protein
MVVINNAIAHEAKEKMGPIPSVILNKEVKFLFLLDTMLGNTKSKAKKSHLSDTNLA